jgi:hypothetical protein
LEAVVVVNVVDAIKANAPPPSGAHIGVVIGTPQAINDSRRAGVRFVIEIVEGPASGRRGTVELVTGLKVGGNRARMLSDCLAVQAWCDCVGVDTAATPTELIAKLRDAGAGKRLEFELNCHRWQGGVDVYLIGVRLAP